MEALFRGLGTATTLRSRVSAEDAPDVAWICAASHHPRPTNALSWVARRRYAAPTRHRGGEAMITWTDEPIAQIGFHSRAAVSYRGQDGYPVTFQLPFT